IDIFDPERLSTSAAVFDQKKLQWMNGEYIKKAPPEKVIELALPHLIAAGRVAEDEDEATLSWVKEIIKLYQEQLHYGAEIVELNDLFFNKDIVYNESVKTELRREQVVDDLQV